jgi:hypothetical protein
MFRAVQDPWGAPARKEYRANRAPKATKACLALPYEHNSLIYLDSTR